MATSSVRDCGCTYRDTGTPPMAPGPSYEIENAAFELLESYVFGYTWAEICNRLVCRDYARRDELHRILHRIAEPVITPTNGPGRKGTLWRLRLNG